MQKKNLWLYSKRIAVAVLCFSPFYSYAIIKAPIVAIDVGESHDNIDIYRFGLQQDFSGWLKGNNIPLRGYVEVSLNYWDANENDAYGIGISPVLYYKFCDECKFSPYIEGGIGGALFNRQKVDDKDISSNFQFEDRIGVGAKMGLFDVHLRYMHYSNGGIRQPNPGMDMYLLGVSYQF